jgi:hypothetical protein
VTIKVPNEQALRDGVAHAELHLDQWHQAAWVDRGILFDGELCGTTACLAGHILLAQGVSWRNLQGSGEIPSRAMRAIGFNDMYADDAWFFYKQVFGFTYATDVGPVGINPDRMKLLKERITEVTGIEL